MFVHNDCRHDARVLKEAKTLTEAGHDVQIVALSGEGLKRVEEKDGFRILRVNRTLFEERRTPRKDKQSSAGDESTTTIGSVLLNYLLRRPLGFLYDWAKNKTSGPLRTLLVAIYRPLSFFQYSRRAWRIAEGKPADVYHCHDLNTLPLGYMAKRRHGGKLVYDAHELTTELAYISRPEKVGWQILERFLIRRADEVITPGTYRTEYLTKRYRVAAPTVILNCPPTLAVQSHSQALRERLGLMDDRLPIILYQGGFIKGRGLHNLVLAAHHLDKGVLVLMGWGVLESELRGLVKKEGLEGKAYFAEPVAPEQVVFHSLSASVGVVIYERTSLNNYYATPNKLYEYMHAGLAVVSSNFPGLKEVVEGYGLGCTFDPEEPESIAAAINWVLGDEGRYDTMRKNALEAAKMFNWEKESKKLVEIYRRLSRRDESGTA